jgi:hypothetical protein
MSESVHASTASNPDMASGQWITPEVSYVDPVRRFCDFCGRPIARRYWQEAEHGAGHIFCEPAHAALYSTYVKRITGDDER